MAWEDEFVLNGGNFNLILRKDLKKSYESCDYESVDDTSLSYLGYVPKTTRKNKNPDHVWVVAITCKKYK